MLEFSHHCLLTCQIFITGCRYYFLACIQTMVHVHDTYGCLDIHHAYADSQSNTLGCQRAVLVWRFDRYVGLSGIGQGRWKAFMMRIRVWCGGKAPGVWFSLLRYIKSRVWCWHYSGLASFSLNYFPILLVAEAILKAAEIGSLIVSSSSVVLLLSRPSTDAWPPGVPENEPPD